MGPISKVINNPDYFFTSEELVVIFLAVFVPLLIFSIICYFKKNA